MRRTAAQFARQKHELKWELRHLPAYLVWTQKSCPILPKQPDRLREVGGRIGLDIAVRR